MALRVWDGGDDSDGTTWAKAYQSIENAAVLGAKHSVHDIWVASDHTEQKNGASFAITLTAATLADPWVCVSVDRSDDSYQSMADGGGIVEGQGGADDIIIASAVATRVVLHGLKLDAGDKMQVSDGGGSLWATDCTFLADDDFRTDGDESVFEGCTFTINTGIYTPGTFVRLRNCTFAAMPASGLVIAIAGQTVLFEDSDLSVEPDIVRTLAFHGSSHTFRRCKLHADWRTDLVDDLDGTGTYVLVESCEAGTDTDPAIGLQLYKSYFGTIIPETTFYLNASDGTTLYSWEMTTTASALERINALVSPDRAMWVEAGAQTVTFHLACDTDTLNDDDFWVEIASPNEASPATYQGRFQTSRPDYQATPQALTAGDNWNGNPTNEYKISFSIAPEEAGWLVYRACHAKPSTTIYFDPRPVIT